MNAQPRDPSEPAAPASQQQEAPVTLEATENPGVAGERGIASINRARSLQSRVSNLLALGLMLALGAGLLTWYYGQMYSRHRHVRQTAQRVSQARAQGDMALPPLGPIDPPAAAVPVSETPAMARLLGPQPPLPAGALPDTPVVLRARAPAAPHASVRARALARRLAGPVFAGPDGAGMPAGADAQTDGAPDAREVSASASPAHAAANRGAAGADRDEDSGALASLLRPSVTPAVRASVLPTQDLLLPKGAFIDCTLETAIDSSLPGLTTCITATDTFSADGRVVLLERGTKLVGETRGVVQQGSARVFVLWTEARTPTGVVVPLASPGTDELGRSGLPGAVNRHFFERFGAAMLISIIDGAVQAGAAAHSNNGEVIVNPTASEDVMTEVLKGTVNIPPTVVKANGDRIQVLVARDLDFRSVYELRPVSTR